MTRNAVLPTSSRRIRGCELGGASASIMEYRWNPDADFSDSEDMDSIRLRISPFDQFLEGQINGGQTRRFGRLSALPSRGNIIARGVFGCSTLLVCRLSSDWLLHFIGSEISFADLRYQSLFDIGGREPHAILQRVIRELQAPGFAANAFIEGCLQTAAIALIREGRSITTMSSESSSRLSASQVAKISEQIEQSGPSIPSIAQLADNAGISSSHFRRLFKATMGCTVQAHVEAIRLRKAQSLLAKPHLPIKLVAYELGFASVSSFSTAFRRRTGLTPKTYRQSISK